MNLLSEINESSNALIKQTEIVTSNLELIAEKENLTFAAINEAAQTFLSTYAHKVANGELNDKPNVKANVINIYGALKALSQEHLADAYDDVPNEPLGSILDNFYGSNGKEAHKVAAARLNRIGQDPSARTYRAQAEEAVNKPESIKGFADKIAVDIGPVMNKLITKEKKQAEASLNKQKDAEKQANMGRPMQGVVPQRSGA